MQCRFMIDAGEYRHAPCFHLGLEPVHCMRWPMAAAHVVNPSAAIACTPDSQITAVNARTLPLVRRPAFSLAAEVFQQPAKANSGNLGGSVGPPLC
jgi:hypothetical protein